LNNEDLYKMILKRKSFHLFMKSNAKISETELNGIRECFATVRPLIEDIKVDMRIVPAKATNCKRGEEYCILLYSEKKDNYLQNIGYIGEQIDLYLASVNIGALWFGVGKVEEDTYNGLSFVIMIAIAKMREDKFRKDMFKARRKPLNEIWSGDTPEYANIVRFAPSACNMQPWIVEKNNDLIRVYRYKKVGKRGIIPADKVLYYNRIDIGIFLCFLDICLEHEGLTFRKNIFIDNADNNVERVLYAEYHLQQ
jgi:hypothetical protein